MTSLRNRFFSVSESVTPARTVEVTCLTAIDDRHVDMQLGVQNILIPLAAGLNAGFAPGGEGNFQVNDLRTGENGLRRDDGHE